jgi:hypothetical protein
MIDDMERACQSDVCIKVHNGLHFDVFRKVWLDLINGSYFYGNVLL